MAISAYVSQPSNFAAGDQYKTHKPTSWRYNGKVIGLIAATAGVVLLGGMIITTGVLVNSRLNLNSSKGFSVLMGTLFPGTVVILCGGFGTSLLILHKVDWNKYHDLKEMHTISKDMATWDAYTFSRNSKYHDNLFKFGFISTQYAEELKSMSNAYNRLYSYDRECKYEDLLNARDRHEKLEGVDNPLYSEANNKFIEDHKATQRELATLNDVWKSYWSTKVAPNLPMLRPAAPSA